jgi:hypothetical protein
VWDPDSIVVLDCLLTYLGGCFQTHSSEVYRLRMFENKVLVIRFGYEREREKERRK